MIGAHTPTAGGFAKSLAYLDATGAGAAQIFAGNPRGWARHDGDPEQDALFTAGCQARGVPVYVHAPLLVNLASPTPATVERSATVLRHGLERAAALGGRAVVFHAGAAVYPDRDPLRQVREALLPLLDLAERLGPRLLVEPSAGGGHPLVARVEQLQPYLAAVNGHPYLGFCFDTCHAWAAGHDLAMPGGATATLDALVAIGGSGRLALVHANDSRDPCGSGRDRHENVGKGAIGEAGFAELLAHPATATVPVIVETPTEGPAGHAADIATLHRLRDG